MTTEERVSSLESKLADLTSTLEEISSKLSNIPISQQASQSSSSSTTPVTPATPDTPAENQSPPIPTPATSAILSPTASAAVATNPTEDVQATFASIKASVQHIRLPAELTLATSGTSGLKKGDQQSHALLSKIARYTETVFKLLQSREDPYEDVFSCLFALMRYIQDEQAALLVQSSFDPTVARFFRGLRRGGGLTPDAIEDLRSAASIAAVYRPPQQHQSSQRSFGRGQQFQHRSGDFFRGSTSRSFPSQRVGRGGFRQGASSQPPSTPASSED